MKLRRAGAFTLIEIVMVIVIISILSAVAVAKYFDIAEEAKAAAEKGVVAGVLVGIHTYFSINKIFPATLDSATAGQACSPANACFTNILQLGGIDRDWTKTGATIYAGPTGTVYIYNQTDGSFK
jgi:prepilin-type N-terminal cleavage/methylation domain-containing protein